MNVAEISHSGRVVACTSQIAKIELDHISKSECGACVMASVCGKGDESVTVEASVPRGMKLAVGSAVRIRSERASRTRANVLLLAMPLVCFLGGIAAALAAGANEAWALLAGAAVCLLGFVMVRLLSGMARPLWKVIQISD